jgi:hypothetical protein
MHDVGFIEAGLLTLLGDFFSDRALEALGAVLLIAITILTRRYIIPLLKTAQARQTAQHLLVIADDVTDYFRAKYPNAHWSNWLDRAVDKIIEITGVGRGPAERAVRAAISRKQPAVIQPKLEGQS